MTIRIESEIGEKRISLYWERHGGKMALACRDVVISRHAPVFVVYDREKDGAALAEVAAEMVRKYGYTVVKVQEDLVDVEEAYRRKREAVRAKVKHLIAQQSASFRMDQKINEYDLLHASEIVERIEAAGVKFVMEEER